MLLKFTHVQNKMTLKFPFIRHHSFAFFFFRLKAGLETLGVLATMQSYPDTFKNCLVFSEEKLTAGLVEDLFKPGLSPGGSNRRVTEERIIGYWMDFLQDAEGRETS